MKESIYNDGQVEDKGDTAAVNVTGAQVEEKMDIYTQPGKNLYYIEFTIWNEFKFPLIQVGKD